MKRESEKGIFAKIAARFRKLGQGHGTIVGFKGESHKASTIQWDESLPDYSQGGTKFSRNGLPQDDDVGRMSPEKWEAYVSEKVREVQADILTSRGGRDNKPVSAPASAESGEKRIDIKPNAEPAPILPSPAVSAKSSERYYPAGHNVWGDWRDSEIANVGTSGARAGRDYSALKAGGVNGPIDDKDWRIRAAVKAEEQRERAAFLRANASNGRNQGDQKRAAHKAPTHRPNGPGLH